MYFDYKAHSLNLTISWVQWVLLDLFFELEILLQLVAQRGLSNSSQLEKIEKNMRNSELWNPGTPDLAITNFLH